MLYKDKKWFCEQVNQGKTVNIVAETLGVSKKTINNWEKIHGVKLKREKRKYQSSCDETFFNNIDTEEKAYILGFIVADGCIGTSGKTGKGKYVDITVKTVDIDILEKIKKSTRLLSNIKDKKNGEQKRIYLTSTKLCDQLEKYGVVKNKTRTVFLPTFKKSEMYRHFFRGLFDGDGYIGERQFVLATGSERLVEDLISFTREQFSLTPNIKTDKSGKNYLVTFSKKDKSFINYMYDNSQIYLDRKFDTYNRYWI